MALFKCKMCGGDLEIIEGSSTAECEFCGSKQPVPKVQDENIQNLFNRANTLRIKSEFDKAEKIYEKIVQVDSSQSEAYWGLILCKYGIEYVDDPATFKKVPTCHRASYDPIIADDDYKSALENADVSQRILYEEQAKEIDRIQKEILALAQKEETYDVFICYKETDANGQRTQDSVIANDIYYQLTQEGFKVFYAAITLEGKLGSAYEPIIFAALNSAKVMLAIGTKPEYFNAVWVKNEWSRYLKIIKKDRSKALIPCYRDMDAYELPEEFAHLQAQDMAKIGFINDLVRGIKKVAKTDEPQATVVKETVVTNNANTAPLLKRAFMFLEDGDWKSADEYCEKVLDIDPECAEAYLGKLMAKLKVKTQKALKDKAKPFDTDTNYQKAVRFANDALRTTLTGYIDHINTRNENARLNDIYTRAKEAMAKAATEDEYKEAAQLFETIPYYKDSDILAHTCLEVAEEEKKRAEEEKKRAEEEKKRAEEEKKKCDLLFEEYIAAIQNEKNGGNKKEEANKKLSSLNEQHKILSVLKNTWQSIEDELFSLNEKLKPVQMGIISLNNERSTLGIFAAKRKKEIAESISALESKQQSLKKEIWFTQRKRQGYSTPSEIDNALNNITQQIDEQRKILEECSLIRPSQLIYNELSAFELGVKLLQEYNDFLHMKKGDLIKFGMYMCTPRDEFSDGKDAIEWLVLEVKNRKALVISKHALDYQAYHSSLTNVTWETCTLRKWLNKDFIDSAFSSDEKAMIPTVTVPADTNPKYSTYPGMSTQDQIFLLSTTEANKYFASDLERQCMPTHYAFTKVEEKYRYAISDSTKYWWWLRTPCHAQTCVAYVNEEGSVRYGGTGVHSKIGIRPALWIDLSKIGE